MSTKKRKYLFEIIEYLSFIANSRANGLDAALLHS